MYNQKSVSDYSVSIALNTLNNLDFYNDQSLVFNNIRNNCAEELEYIIDTDDFIYDYRINDNCPWFFDLLS